MVLLTGATGFLGRAVLRRLTDERRPTRVLLRPSPRTPALPRGEPTPVTLSALTDAAGVRAALVGVRHVIHLASAERRSSRSETLLADAQGTRLLAQAAAEAGVERLIFVSHLGADRASAYPLMRAKGIAEEHVRQSGAPSTIVRAGALFGPGDVLTCGLAMALALAPLVLPVPASGAAVLQPLWVEDLVTCLLAALDDPAAAGQTYALGGPEFLSFREITHMVMGAASLPRILFALRAPYLRAVAALLESSLPLPPIPTLWVDYLAVSRTAELSGMPRAFGLHPARLQDHLDHLRGRNWGWDVLAFQFRPERARGIAA